LTRKVDVYSWTKKDSKLEFTVPDWLENVLVCEICGNSNSFLYDYPNEDPKDHSHYFTKLLEYQKLPQGQREPLVLQISKSKEKPIIQIEKYLNTVIKNDPVLVKQLLRAYLSAYTNNPVNIGVLAQSSEGKTYTTVQVSNIFPIEDIILIGRICRPRNIYSITNLL